MADIIQLLPDSVANQIAAGEVVQRPANVVKELVENSIDAGATNIDILIIDAGRTSIRVIDNGKGMSETDARLSFERHATSKIRQASDLFALHTMGFRGEALASIAAVAQVDLRTRQASDEIGTMMTIEGSRFVGQQPCACSVGCDFNVQNLFYNVPARRKFLKSDTTERNNIITAFQRIALVYPNITFTLSNNDVSIMSLPATTLKQRIVDVFGKKIGQELLSLSIDTSLCRISGFVGCPESAHKKGVHQYFFANKRFMKHPYFNKAVAAAFDRLIPVGEMVPYFIYFDVPPENIDININPTKTEIKFENEQAIWQILSSGIRETIGLDTNIAAIDFDNADKPNIPVFGSDSDFSQPKMHYDDSFNPFNQHIVQREKPVAQWQDLYAGLSQSPAKSQSNLFAADDDWDSKDTESNDLSDASPTHYQYKGRYIMTAVKSGLMIIDQHRAHVRVLYEQYLEQLQEKKPQSESTMFPETIEVSAGEQIVLQHIMPELEAIGFELTSLGGNSYAINSVPSSIGGVNTSKLLHEIIASAADGETSAVEEIRKKMASTMARNIAIEYGEVMSNGEMDTLINALFVCSNTNRTPDGQTIMCILKQSDIEHLLR